MNIDILTISIILGITHLMQILVFYYQYKANKNIMGPGWWLLWSLAEIIGFILIALRKNPLFQPYAIIFQNTFILAGTIFIYNGINRFLNKKIYLKFVIPFFISFFIFHLYYYYIKDDIIIRSLVFSIFIATISFITAGSLYRSKSKSIALTANFNIGVFVAHGIIFTYRAIMIGWGTNVTDIFSPTFFNYLPYFDALIVSLLWTFGFIMMVNERLNSEIREAKLHFELIFNTSPDAALITRMSDGLFIDCNESFTRISGYNKEDILKKSTLGIRLWRNPEDRSTFTKLISEKGAIENFEALIRRKNGQVFTGLISAKTIMINNETHLISVTRDISERKQVEEEIRNKNEELRKLNAEKDKFFTIIAHDLRGPLSLFLGLSEIMVENLKKIKLLRLRQQANAMRDSAANLFKLLENLLEWSSLELGAISFKPINIKVFQLINESLKMIQELAKSKSIEITCDIPDNIEIFGDKNILQTVIRNLISNSIKFTPRGGKIHISANTDDFDNIKISIRDSGIGMSADMVNNLFNLSAKTNRKGTEGESSTGLGLILCKNFIEKHGGKIWVESEEGKGSIFTFTIPNKS